MFTPNNTVFLSCGTLNLTATQTGAYAFDVFESGAFAIGQYRVTLLCNLGPCVATAPPSLVLTLTGCTICHPGDTFTVQAVLKNPGPVGVPIELKLGLRLPDGSPASLLGASGDTWSCRSRRRSTRRSRSWTSRGRLGSGRDVER